MRHGIRRNEKTKRNIKIRSVVWGIWTQRRAARACISRTCHKLCQPEIALGRMSGYRALTFSTFGMQVVREAFDSGHAVIVEACCNETHPVSSVRFGLEHEKRRTIRAEKSQWLRFRVLPSYSVDSTRRRQNRIDFRSGNIKALKYQENVTGLTTAVLVTRIPD